ncbi:MAG: hypothetical protein QM778_30510 [Myxococcales bacterium]
MSFVTLAGMAGKKGLGRKRALPLRAWTLASCVVALGACSDSAKHSSPEASEFALSGRAFGSDVGQPIVGAGVAIGKKSVNTDAQGGFELTYTQDDGTKLIVSEKEYAPVSKEAPAGKGYLEVFAKRIDASVKIDADKGGSVRSSKGAGVSVKAGSLVDKDGVSSKMAELSVAAPDSKRTKELATLPGDFDAKGKGVTGKLSAGSAVFVGAREDDKALELVQGQKATLTVPVHEKKKAAEPTLYWFDEAQNAWLELGPAVAADDSEGLSVYSAEIDRLGWFAVGELISELTCLHVCVEQADQQPARFAQVVASGVELFTRSSAFAGEDGCAVVEVPAHAQVTLSAQARSGAAPAVVFATGSGGQVADGASCQAAPKLVLSAPAAGSCPLGFTPCAGACIDPTDDPLHCGTCDVSCAAEACVAGACGDPVAQPDAGSVDAGGTPTRARPSSTAVACLGPMPAPVSSTLGSRLTWEPWVRTWCRSCSSRCGSTQ